MKKFLFYIFSLAAIVSCSKGNNITEDEFDKAVKELPGVYLSANYYGQSGYGRVISLEEGGNAEITYFFDDDVDDGVDVDSTYTMEGTWKALKANMDMGDNIISNLAVNFEMTMDGSTDNFDETCYYFNKENKIYLHSSYFGLDEFFKINSEYVSFLKELESFISKRINESGETKGELSKASDFPTNGDNWMASIPDNVYIRDLSIPGSHDAFSYRSIVDAQVQTENATKQFNYGVRYFDCRYYLAHFAFRDKVYPCHGDIGICANLCWTIKSDFERIEKCIAEHPTECAFVMLKHDRSQSDDKVQYCRTWLEKNVFNKPVYISFKEDMTLGEARGKIILMYRGMEWNDKPGAYPWDLNQDDCEFDEDEDYVGSKTASFKEYVDKRAVISPKGKKFYNDGWCVNHCSGYVQDSKLINKFQPVKFTSGVYPQLLHVLETTSNKTFGFVPMDFVGRNGYVREDIKFWSKYWVQTQPIIDELLKSNALLK